MAIITKINKSKRWRAKPWLRRNMKYWKRHAHRAYRHNTKQALHCDKEINEKPRLTGWDII